MRRSYWIAYWLIAALWFVALGVLTFGPTLEAVVAPVRIGSEVGDVVRDGRTLCWRWSSDKVRDRVSDDVDVFVHAGNDRFVAAVFRQSDERPWSHGAALPLGHSDQRWCTTLPPFVRAGDHVRVQWRAWYPGLLGLWRVPLVLPDVLDPPEPKP